MNGTNSGGGAVRSLAAALLLSAAVAAAGADDARGVSKLRLFELCGRRNAVTIFPGRVEYARTMTISFEEAGRLSYVARAGTQAKCDVFDLQGKLLRAGDVLARQDAGIPESRVKIAEARYKEADLRLAEREQNFERDRKLFEKQAVSAKQFLQTRIDYETAVVDREAAVADLELARRVLDGCTARAPFPCVVDAVFFPAGTGVDKAQEVMRISALDTMKIVVPLPEFITRQLDLTLQICVYPPGDPEPAIAWFQTLDIKTAALECYVNNPSVPVGALTPEQERLPRVDVLTFVFAPNDSNRELAPLWVQPSALHRRDGRFFVWKLDGQRAVASGAPIARECRAVEVPVEALDCEFQQGVFRLRGIRAEGLSPYDIVAGAVPAAVRSGDRVVYRNAVRRFRPGETVGVTFSRNFENNHYYLPQQALRRDPRTGALYILVRDRMKLLRLPVSLMEENGAFAHVASPALRDGIQVAITGGDAAEITPEMLADAEVERLSAEALDRLYEHRPAAGAAEPAAP